LCFLPDS